MRTRIVALLIAIAVVCAGHSAAHAQRAPAFDAGDPSTYPPGTHGCTAACTSGTITLPLPAKGVLTFSRFTADGAFTITFTPNTANSPVTIRVTDDVVLHAPACCGHVSVSGHDGANGTAAGPGLGGAGGPGGYEGGYGHGQPITGFTIGGNGLGPGGGVGATTTIQAVGGEFVGPPELDPIVGGSGGGGGSGIEGPACTGGGGGGGGGGLLIVAGGRISLRNFELHADGGNGGDVGDRTCAQGGAGGSGGGIRLVARTFEQDGSVTIMARGGRAGYKGLGGTAGRIRLESWDQTALKVFLTEPEASRVRVK
jgi:hypothetical protein